MSLILKMMTREVRHIIIGSMKSLDVREEVLQVVIAPTQ